MSRRVVGVVLCGGRSQRMGSPKALLHDPGGRTLLQASVEGMRSAGIREVVVVTGFRPAAIAREARARGATPAHNRFFDRGQWSSVRTGLRAALRRGATRVILGPVDVPCASPATLVALARSPSDWALPVYQGEPGHPIGLSASLCRALLADRRSADLRAALQAARTPPGVVEVDDRQILAQLNTPTDYRAWLSWRGRSR